MQTIIEEGGESLQGKQPLHSFFFIRILFFLCTDAQPPEKLCDFCWLQLQITWKSGRIAQAEKKILCQQREKGKVSLQRRGGQRLKAVL